jgi:hypothetical protein
MLIAKSHAAKELQTGAVSGVAAQADSWIVRLWESGIHLHDRYAKAA